MKRKHEMNELKEMLRDEIMAEAEHRTEAERHRMIAEALRERIRNSSGRARRAAEDNGSAEYDVPEQPLATISRGLSLREAVEIAFGSFDSPVTAVQIAETMEVQGYRFAASKTPKGVLVRSVLKRGEVAGKWSSTKDRSNGRVLWMPPKEGTR